MATVPPPTTMKAIKREAPDDEPMIIDNPPKRQALQARDALQTNGTTPPNEPPVFTEDQLRGRSSQDLIEVILHLQSSYSQQVAELKGQYASLSHQLNDMKATLSAFLTANVAALHSITQMPRDTTQAPRAVPEQASQAIPQPQHSFSASSRQSIRSGSVSSIANASQREAPDTGGLAAPVSHSTPGPPSRFDRIAGAEPTVSPSPSFPTPASAAAGTSFSTLDHAGTPSSSAAPLTLPAVTQPTGDGPPVVECTNFNTVQEIWQEYRYGVPSQPAPIETLDATWGPRWRPEAKIRTWYSRRKLIYDKVKELIADGIDEATAVQEVESMRRGRTINWLMRLLQEDRKETRASWKAAAAAATAAAQVVHSRPALEPPSPAVQQHQQSAFQHSSF